MKYVMDHTDKPHRMFFEQICEIPHESFKEKALAQWLVQFAIDRGLWFYQDELWNVVIKKPASPGCEEHPPIMLQAHIDMVCVKSEGSDFNFDTDPLKLYTEDGWLKAKDTTLGADCGHGVAYMLAVLDDNNLTHPPLECFFSVQEEVGIGGPLFIDYSVFAAKKLINFDMMMEGCIFTSTTAVDGGNLLKSIRREETDRQVHRLTIEGGTGGHGGADIGKDRANAIKLCANALYNILKEVPLGLVSIDGGTARNNLPASCSIAFSCDSALIGRAKEIASEIFAGFKTEYELTDPSLSLSIEALPEKARPMEDRDTQSLIGLLMALPTGAKLRRPLSRDSSEAAKLWALEDFIVSSQHMGKIETSDDTVTICYQFRSCLDSQMREMKDQALLIAGCFDAAYAQIICYPGYRIGIDAPLNALYADVYREKTGKSIEGLDIHAGTDVGTILRNIPGMDATTIGPNTTGVHTPKEQMEIASFDRVYEYLKEMLKKL